MLRKGLSLILFIVVLSALVSCKSNDVIQPKIASPVQENKTSQSAGELHNEILSAFAEGHNLFLTKMSKAEFTKLFIKSANNVLRKHGVDFKVDERFVESKIAEFEKFKEECGYDFFHPGSDPETAFSYLEEKGVISHEKARNLRSFWMNIKETKDPSQYRPGLISKDALGSGPAIDIMDHSAQWWKNYYEYMEEYVQDHPEIRGWWDKWKKRIREWFLIGSDALGGLIGTGSGPGGAIAGAALASVVFTMAWAPY